ncbi:unnamed protein product [Somion occarium]|uniref:Uncharacterized protein n=1 Tax=Somion occarium TaxID=3059160 RepID=A0ABP1D472_9APHY
MSGGSPTRSPLSPPPFAVEIKVPTKQSIEEATSRWHASSRSNSRARTPRRPSDINEYIANDSEGSEWDAPTTSGKPSPRTYKSSSNARLAKSDLQASVTRIAKSRVGPRTPQRRGRLERIIFTDDDDSVQNDAAGASGNAAQYVKRQAASSAEENPVKIGPPRKRQKQFKARSPSKATTRSTKTLHSISTSKKSSFYISHKRPRSRSTSESSLSSRGDDTGVDIPPVTSSKSLQTSIGSSTKRASDSSASNLPAVLSDTARGKQPEAHQTASTAPPSSVSQHFSTSSDAEDIPRDDGPRELDAPTWTYLEKAPVTPPEDVSPHASSSMHTSRPAILPGTVIRCACRRKFRVDAAKRTFCEHCLYKTLMRSGQAGRAKALFPNGPPGGEASDVDELRDEMDEQEVEAATVIRHTSPQSHQTISHGFEDHMSLADGAEWADDDVNLKYQVEDRDVGPNSNVHKVSPSSGPVDIRDSPSVSKKHTRAVSVDIDATVTNQTTRRQSPVLSRVEIKTRRSAKPTSAIEYQHLNDLLYSLAGITNGIHAAKTSKQAASQIRFKGFALRVIDVRKWPLFPLVNERLLNEIASEVKAKAFLPFILPRKQFDALDGQRRGVLYLCQCLENSPGQQCCGKLQITLTSIEAEHGMSAVSIHVALDH